MTALWFAVQDEGRWDDDGVLFGFDAAQLVSSEGGDIEVPPIGRPDQGSLRCVFVKLPASNERMKMQRGAFVVPPLVFGDHRDLLTILDPAVCYAPIADMTDLRVTKEHAPDPAPIVALIVPADSKPAIKSLLTRSFGYTAHSVYPDLPGYCLSNSAAVEFDDRLWIDVREDYEPYATPDLCVVYPADDRRELPDLRLPKGAVSAWLAQQDASRDLYQPSGAIAGLGVDSSGVIVVVGEAIVIDPMDSDGASILRVESGSPDLRDRFVGFAVAGNFPEPYLGFTSRYFPPFTP
jgi:hypothetical protein